MPRNSFFGKKQAAAILKHGILGRYLSTFCSKTGARSTGNRVVFLDGYAGQGVYDDGQPGSPILASRTASSLAKIRSLLGLYIERDRRTADELASNLARTDHDHHIMCGELEDCLPEALDMLQDTDPLFAFFDPFGLPISMTMLARVMEHSRMSGSYRQGPPTEVLVTFSYPGLRRNAGHLTSASTKTAHLKGQPKRFAALDEILGGQWWREIWMSGQDDRVSLIASGYANRLAEEMQARAWYQVPISDRWDGPTVYDLLFFTQFPEEGIWYFNQCVSLAIEDFQKLCSGGQLELDPRAREEGWSKTIESNIQQILQETGSFTLAQQVIRVYGSTLGHAREKHVRVALKRLHQAGSITHDGKGDVPSAYIERT